MTDAIAQAAGQLNQPQDAQQAASEAGKPEANSSSGTSSAAPAIPVTQTQPTSNGSSVQGDSGNGAGGASPAQSPVADSASAAPAGGNVLVNGAPSPAPSSTQPTSPAAESTAEPMPRESHLMLLEHKLAAMHAKFKTGERIVIDEFEQILGHIKAVL